MSEHSKPTQAQRVLDYIREFGSITQLEAFIDLGVMRLASRVSELKEQGHDIISNTEAASNRFGEKVYIKRYYINESGHGEKPRRCV